MITSFFKKQNEVLINLKLTEPIKSINNDINFESVLLDLKILLNNKTLSFQSKSQLQLIFQFINLRKMGYKVMDASQIVAESIRKEKYQAELIHV